MLCCIMRWRRPCLDSQYKHGELTQVAEIRRANAQRFNYGWWAPYKNHRVFRRVIQQPAIVLPGGVGRHQTHSTGKHREPGADNIAAMAAE